MLSYLHSFHAGNHADILKHATLFYVLEYLNKKDTPYSFFDTHAGSGLYNLKSENSLKTKEAEKGILHLLEQEKQNPSEVPSSFLSYINFVKSFIKSDIYPGSPIFEISFSKKGSVVNLNELHKKEFENLKTNVDKIKKTCTVKIFNTSGWDTLKNNVPPLIKRGAVLCDPSYEEKSDYYNAGEKLSSLHKKWNAAIIMLWYPLLKNKEEEIENMKQQILSTVKNQDEHTEVLDATLLIDKEDSHIETTLQESIGSEKPRLYGSGMFIVKPCWHLKEYLEQILPYLCKTLGRDGNASYKVEML